MHNAETASIKRAVLVLVVVSAARWGWSLRPQGGGVAEEDVLPQLVAATQEAGRGAAERNRPLAEGERVDPNLADAATLDRLPGVGPVVALAIVAARDSGAAFLRGEDLLKVRGVGPALLEKMRPSLDLTAPPGRSRNEPRGAPAVIDLNRADLPTLQALPGIGPALAGRIVAERNARPFASVEDLVRVRGIGPATMTRIRPLVVVR